MRRWMVVSACLLGLLAVLAWGVPRILDQRPNPILVTVSEPGAASGGASVSRTFEAAEATALTEVEVARARAVRMKLVDVPVAGAPPGADEPMLFPDADALAAEMTELRAALDAWATDPARNLKVVQTWESSEFHEWAFMRTEHVRVVLHARLVPAASAGK